MLPRNLTLYVRLRLGSEPLVADRRGVAAMEASVIFAFMALSLLIPLSDLGVAALRFLGAYQSMRDLGAYAQYHQPPDVTDLSSWTALPTMAGVSTSVICGTAGTTAACSTGASPKWFKFTSTVTLTPMILPLGGPYTINYTERFQ